MKFPKIVLIKYSLLLALVACFVIVSYFARQTPKEVHQPAEEASVDAKKFFDNELFTKGVSGRIDFKIDKPVKGAIVPHHMLSAYLMSGLFSQFGHDFDTIIVLGPNHSATGENIAYTSDIPFETAFGRVEVDKVIIGKITGNSAIKIDNDILGEEYSVNIPINYIKRYLPVSKVVPLVLNETNDINKINGLALVIEPYLNDRVLVVASVDLSHYLGETEAREKDLQTIKAIGSGDYRLIKQFDDSNLDSSSSVILLDMLMKHIGADDFQLLINTNSAEITGYNKDVTSYVLGIYN